MTKERFSDLSGRRLYLCTPDRQDLKQFVSECVAGGVDIVQLREKHLEARQLVARAMALRQVCRSLGVPFILNDRPDLALECDADGVHVGQEDAPPRLARRVVGPDRLVGYSTHRPSQLAEALSEPVDYLSVGPVVATPTKPGRPGTGPGYVARAAEMLGDASDAKPFFVTGGVTPESIPGLWKLGARRFVVVRYLTTADEPRRRAEELREAIEQQGDDALEGR